MIKKQYKIVIVITDLATGGAEMMLCRLLEFIDRDRFECRVVSLVPAGAVGEKIRALGVPVHSLGMRAGRPSMRAFFSLAGLLRRERPDLIHTWMYHADLLGSLAASLIGTPVVWGIHNTSLDPAFVKSGTIRVARLNARLSHWLPRRIVICSNESRQRHLEIGYASEKFVTIPNGYDLDRFRPDPSARLSVRQELGLAPETFLIGLAARFDPLKDHGTFVQAAGLFIGRHPQAHFLLCGGDITWENEKLVQSIDQTGSRSSFHLLGQRDDMPRLLAGLDLNTLSSLAEAFPNVLAEAMGCGIPCVTTDVGDAAEIVGDTGVVVASGNAPALAEACERLAGLSASQRAELGQRARERIQSRYRIQDVVKQYENLYLQIVRLERV